jgi:hypothetical protein
MNMIQNEERKEENNDNDSDSDKHTDNDSRMMKSVFSYKYQHTIGYLGSLNVDYENIVKRMLRTDYTHQLIENIHQIPLSNMRYFANWPTWGSHHGERMWALAACKLLQYKTCNMLVVVGCRYLRWVQWLHLVYPSLDILVAVRRDSHYAGTVHSSLQLALQSMQSTRVGQWYAEPNWILGNTWNANSAKNKRVALLCAIDEEKGTRETDNRLLISLMLQVKWVHALHPTSALLRYRIPYLHERDRSRVQDIPEEYVVCLEEVDLKTAYLNNPVELMYVKGTYYLPVWASHNSTELWVVSDGNQLYAWQDLGKQDVWERKMFYHNAITRCLSYHRGPTHCTLAMDCCYDCSREKNILKTTTTHNNSTLGVDVEDAYTQTQMLKSETLGFLVGRPTLGKHGHGRLHSPLTLDQLMTRISLVLNRMNPPHPIDDLVTLSTRYLVLLYNAKLPMGKQRLSSSPWTSSQSTTTMDDDENLRQGDLRQGDHGRKPNPKPKAKAKQKQKEIVLQKLVVFEDHHNNLYMKLKRNGK